jgi:hypothetical protein
MKRVFTFNLRDRIDYGQFEAISAPLGSSADLPRGHRAALGRLWRSALLRLGFGLWDLNKRLCKLLEPTELSGLRCHLYRCNA